MFSFPIYNIVGNELLARGKRNYSKINMSSSLDSAFTRISLRGNPLIQFKCSQVNRVSADSSNRC